MQGAQEGDTEEAAYDDLLGPNPATSGSVKGPNFGSGSKRLNYYQQRSYGHYSQWGPKRPRHTMNYPTRKSAVIKNCMCHPLLVTCVVLFNLFGVVSLIGTMVLISYYAQGYFSSPYNKSVDFGPGDTQNLFFSPLFCEELSPDKDSLYSDTFLPSNLYALNAPLTLTGDVEVLFEDVFLIFDKSYERNIHLFPGSVISFETCSNNDSYYEGVATFYLVKGKSTYETWSRDSDKTKPPSITSFHIWNYCNENKHKFDMIVVEEDQYYFIFINHKQAPYIAEINANYSIQRRVYAFNVTSIASSCSFTVRPCTLVMPFWSTAYLVLVYGEPKDWSNKWNNKAIEVSCTPRVWFYTLLTVLGVLAMAGCTFLGCLSCCCINRLMMDDSEAEEPLLSGRTGTLYDDTADVRELSNPSNVDFSRSKTKERYGIPTSRARRIQLVNDGLHSPPSFKNSPSSRFVLGSPTFETFTKK